MSMRRASALAGAALMILSLAACGESDSASPPVVIEVDLGPSHELEQFSAQANVLEAAGDYWVVRDVRIQ